MVVQEDSSHQIVIAPGSIKRGTPETATGAIKAGLASMDACRSFFAASQVSQISIVNDIVSGNSTWIQTTDKNGQPAYFAQAGDDTYLTLTSDIDTKSMMSGGDPTKPFIWNGKTYNLAGSVNLSFSSGGQSWLMDAGVYIIGPYATISLAQAAITKILSSWLKGANDGLGKLNLINSEQDAGSAARNADEAGCKNILSDKDTEEIAADWGSFIGAFAGICIIYAITEYLLYPEMHSFTIYNLTKTADITWCNEYTYEGTNTSEPAKAEGSSPNNPNYVVDYVIPRGRLHGPANLNPVMMYSDGSFQWQSGQATGLGYVYTISFSDGGSSYKATIMFDIPHIGDNSFAVTFDSVTDYQKYYSDNQGVNTSGAASATSQDGKYKISITYDAVSGEQVVPGGNGDQAYFYNSLVVLEAV